MFSTQELGHEESVLQMSQPLSDIEKVSYRDVVQYKDVSAREATDKMVKRVLKMSEEDCLDLTGEELILL